VIYLTSSKMGWLNLQWHPTTAKTTGLTIRPNGQQCPPIQHTVHTRTRFYYCVFLHCDSMATINGGHKQPYLSIQWSYDEMTDERQNLARNTNKDFTTDSYGMSWLAVLINLLVEETNQLYRVLKHIRQWTFASTWHQWIQDVSFSGTIILMTQYSGQTEERLTDCDSIAL
jgi:hypothetical protein